MQVSLINTDNPAWNEVLGLTPHDFYHLPAYADLCAHAEKADSARAVLVQDGPHRMLQPLVWRKAPDQAHFEVTSPYGYGGPITTSADPDFLRQALTHAFDELRGAGVVSAFLKTHPLLSFPNELLAEFGTVVPLGDCVVIELSDSPEEMWRQTRGNHRTHINKGKRNGMSAMMDEEWSHFDAFGEIYAQTMERVGASQRYKFDRSYFTALREALGSSLHLCVVAVDGQPACAGLFVETCGIVQYHLAGTADEFLGVAPSKTMFHFVRLWAKERANQRFFLGGGYGGENDALLNFKRGFSKTMAPLQSLRAVLLPTVYADLLAQSHPSADPEDLTGFFPRYRAP